MDLTVVLIHDGSKNDLHREVGRSDGLIRSYQTKQRQPEMHREECAVSIRKCVLPEKLPTCYSVRPKVSCFRGVGIRGWKNHSG